jgi:2-polyprenyl-3-methyl-5-hydroxy-6-metoxy-1,4-benzoquinol methylase
LPAEKILEYFGPNSFDVVISTETLEHVIDWRLVIRNMKEAVKPRGYIYVTAAPIGFGYHPYPYDCWRFEVSDMRKIFADFEIIILEEGVKLKARKPENYIATELSEIELYSMVLKRKTKETPLPNNYPRSAPSP